MRIIIATVACALTLSLAVGADEESNSYADRLQKITSEYSKNFQKDRALALRTKNAAIKALAEEAAQADLKELDVAEHLALTDVFYQARRYEDAVKHARIVIEKDPDDESVFPTLIRSLVSAKQFQAAEDTFRDAKQRFPDSRLLDSLQGTMYSANMNAGRFAVAARHLGAYVEYSRARLLSNRSTSSTTFDRYVTFMVDAYRKADATEEALEKLDALAATLQGMPDEERRDVIESALQNIESNRLKLFVAAGKADEARKLAASALKKAKGQLKAKPDDESAILAVANALSLRADIEAESKSDDVDVARGAYRDFLAGNLHDHPTSMRLLDAFVNTHGTLISSLTRSGEIDEAEKLFDSVNKVLTELKTADTDAQQRIETAKRRIGPLKSRIESERTRLALIGNPAVPIDADAWINGSPAPLEELKGKVVLLDFWAVWCGPCIATFPHLRDWHDRFSDKGLVIIGVTRYYRYGWDADTERPARQADITPQEEREETLKFLGHHGLKHRIAFQAAEATTSKDYGVTGIPQAVVIDRAGKVRLIRVGSGEANAQAIEELLEKLLAETAGAASGG